MLNLKKNQKGLAAIELTLVIPFLLLLIFATAEFSRLLYQYNALTKVVRNATRYISSHARDASSNLIEVTAGDTNIAKKLLIYGDLNNSTAILPNLAATTFTISVSGEFITVTASYPWQPIFSTQLSSFVSSDSYDLSFPLVTHYTMRVL